MIMIILMIITHGSLRRDSDETPPPRPGSGSEGLPGIVRALAVSPRPSRLVALMLVSRAPAIPLAVPPYGHIDDTRSLFSSDSPLTPA